MTICLLLLVVVAALATKIQQEVSVEAKLRYVKQQLNQNGEKIYRSFNKTTDTDEFAETLLQHESYLKKNGIHKVDAVVDVFDCTVYGPTVPKPTSVHQLTIADIDVVAAIGDSITAAFGADATSLFNLFNEYRGVSFSGGGTGTVVTSLTFPNFIKAYNPKIVGFATGTGAASTPQAVLDQAITGALVQELMDQAVILKNLLLANSSYNFANSWKAITILIGPNNLCDVCLDATFNGAAAYSAALEQVLDYIGANIPRAFISVIPPMDVTLLYPLSDGLCGLLHGFECECAVSSDPAVRANVSATVVQYFQATQALLSKTKYTQNTTWTVVLQPFLQNTVIPKLPNGDYDLSYFAPDCFHFSTKSHQCAAISLFNNIMEDVGSKRNSFVVGEPIECPTPGEYLKTVLNSPKK